MKTLDEVIAMLEAYPVTPSSLDFDVTIVRVSDIDDVLHYLKEYRERKEMLRYWGEKAISEQQNVVDAYMLYKIASEKRKKENPLLAWDELKTMEGKPVWIEAKSISVGVSPYWKDWYIIKSFTDDEYMLCNDGYEWGKETQGSMWQAYQKERE